MLLNNKKYLTEKEIAAHFKMSIFKFRHLRYAKNGLVIYKINNRLFFLIEDVADWLENKAFVKIIT